MFQYFADPLNFTYLRADDTPCHFCGATSHRLDGKHLRGMKKIRAICFACMDQGELIALDIAANEVDHEAVADALGESAAESLIRKIVYCTPTLPTWQDCDWPFVDGDFAKFIKIAAKPDFTDQQQFADSIDDSDPDWLWSMLPDHPVTTIKEGQYDVSVYLFRSGNRLVTIWDAN